MLCVPLFCHFLSPSTGSKKIIQYGGLAGGISIHSAAASTYVQCSKSLMVNVFRCYLTLYFFVSFFIVLSPLFIYRWFLHVLSPSSCLYLPPPSLLLSFLPLIHYLTPRSKSSRKYNLPSLISSPPFSFLFSLFSILFSLLFSPHLSASLSLCFTNAVVTAPWMTGRAPTMRGCMTVL